MGSQIFDELFQLIEQSLLSPAEKSVLLACLHQLEDSSFGSEAVPISIKNIFTTISGLQKLNCIPLRFLSLFLAKYPGQIPIFSLFKYYYQAWQLLPESIKSKPDSDESGLTKRTTSQLKESYGNILTLFSPGVLRPALIDAGSGNILSHQALFEFVETFSLPIEETVLKPVIVLALPNGSLLGLALIATMAYYTAVPINTNGGPEQFRSDVLQTHTRHILTIEDDIQRLRLRDNWVSEAQIEVFLLEQKPDLTFTVSSLDSSHSTRLIPRQPNSPDDTVLILFTSGTTGKKKMVPVTLHNVVSGISCIVDSWGLVPDEICLNMMPLNHVGGIVRNLLAPVFAGGSTILCPAFDPNVFWDLVGNQGATWYYASPSMHLAILAECKNQTENLARHRLRLICNAAGGLLPSLATELKNTFECTILPSYGMTECMPICTPPLDYKLDRKGTSGKACGPEIAVLNANKEPLSSFQTGHISVRGGPTFAGYLTSNNDIDTSCFDASGYFDTGDLGYLDEDGYLYITGRSKEVINRGGELISPLEVEEAIIAAARTPDSPIYQRVDEALIFSAPHELLQEVVGVAVVVPRGQKRPDLREMHAAIKTSLHQSKWPVSIVYMDDLPKGNNKLLRIGLAERLDLSTIPDGEILAIRHFEAICPPRDTPLRQKIAKNACDVDCKLISNVIMEILGEKVDVYAGIHHHDGFPEVVLAPSPSSTLGLEEDHCRELLEYWLKDLVDHYHIPSTYTYLDSPLPRDKSGIVDAQLLAKMVHAKKLMSTATLSATEKKIRDIFVVILSCSSDDLSSKSDFFEMGGDSLSAGRLLSTLRRKVGVALAVDRIFNASRICDLASAVDAELQLISESSSETYNEEQALPGCEQTYSSTNPFLLVIQLLPILLIYPLKSAFRWIAFMYALAFLSDYWANTEIAARFLGLVGAMTISRIAVVIAGPFAGIALKWLIIGRHKEGLYPMWGPYHTRWWLVQKILIVFGKGMFSYFYWSRVLYYRMLGAKIGKGVKIEPGAILGEYDLLDIGDYVRIDPCVCRPFAVERNTSMYLGKIKLGNNASVGLKACVAPGSVIEEGDCIGPNSSSYEVNDETRRNPHLSRSQVPETHSLLKVLAIYPIQVVVIFMAALPWMCGLLGIVKDKPDTSGDELISILLWWASPGRVAFHYIARQLDTLVRPLIWFALIVFIKKLTDKFIGKTKPGPIYDISLLARFRTSLLAVLMPPGSVHEVASLFGTHYEVTSIIARALGAKVGSRVYWPGTGPSIQNYDLLEIGDDVVFGSRSHIVTTDGIGNDAVRIGSGSMVADRVILLPGTTLEERVVLGSGAITERSERYSSGSVWIGNRNGKAISLSGSDKSSSTTSSKGFEGNSKSCIKIEERCLDATPTSSSTSVTNLSLDEEKALPCKRETLYFTPNSSMTSLSETSEDEKAPSSDQSTLHTTPSSCSSSVIRISQDEKMAYSIDCKTTDEEMGLADVKKPTSSPFGRAFYEGKANYCVIGLIGITLYSVLIRALAQVYWDAGTIFMIQSLALLARHGPAFLSITWYRPFIIFAFSVALESLFTGCLSFLALAAVVGVKWVLIGRRKVGNYDWDKSSYCQRWQIFLSVEMLRHHCFGGYGVIGMLTGTHYAVMYFRALGAKIGKDCALFAGGRPSLVFTEPELLELGDRVAIDDASLVAHINTRGKFDLNSLRVGSRSVLRTGSRLLSGAQMGEDSCLLEHTLIMAGDMADEKTTYQGWPANVFTKPRVNI